MTTTSTGHDLRLAVQEIVDAGFAGAQLRVRDEHGEWTGSAGARMLGDPEPPSTDGRFWIGSTTKPFTATVVLQLVAEGAVGLESRVADVLPHLGLDDRITVRMLLQHTSGLYNYTGELADDGTFVPGIPSIGKDWVDHRFRTYTAEELVRGALAQPARFEPGTGFSYANTNYTLAVLLVEQVTGRAYADELARRVLEPLGLHDTVVPGGDPRLPEPHAHGYTRYEDVDGWHVVDVTQQNSSMLIGAGDLVSTTADLATFASALAGGRLLPAPLLTEMSTPHPPIGYGLGLFVQDLGDDAGVVLHHNGGAPGGFGALMYTTPGGGKTLTASFTMGDAPTDPAAVFPGVLARLVGQVFGPVPGGAQPGTTS